MPSPRLLPDNDVLMRLRNQGWTYDEIANHYGVSRGAVYLRLRQTAGGVNPRPTYDDLIPWTVAVKHTHAHPVLMLRLLGRRKRGLSIPPVKERMLDKWLRELEVAGVVVCYDVDMAPNPASPTVGGFYYSRRRPGETGLVRKPEEV